MSNQIFKKEDRVFDINYGWGIIQAIDNFGFLPIDVYFENNYYVSYTKEGKKYNSSISPTLSFTEYGVDYRFCQERPIDYTGYIGKWGRFWLTDNPKEYTISKLERIKLTGFVSKTSIVIYDHFEPFTDEQIKILNLE